MTFKFKTCDLKRFGWLNECKKKNCPAVFFFFFLDFQQVLPLINNALFNVKFNVTAQNFN